jgi:hypothetical protein
MSPASRPRGRRWLLGALGGAVAGFTASKLGNPPNAQAEDGDEIHVGESHSGRRTTGLTMLDQSDPVGLRVEHTAVTTGFSIGSIGILGIGQGTAGAGVRGEGNVHGVVGVSDSTGVEGRSNEGRGVRGTTAGSGPALFPAAGGRFETFANDSLGLHALAVDPILLDPIEGSIALLAQASSGNVAARLEGPVQFAPFLELSGEIDLDALITVEAAPGGVAARFEGVTEFAAAPGGVSARFAGPTEFTGSMVVAGQIAQTVTPAGGSPVQSFPVRSLDSWIEDFGGAQMAGTAQVRVDLRPEFTAVADVSNYHVFIQGVGGDTPQVTQKDASGFTVTAQNANKAPQSISYRLVAPPR